MSKYEVRIITREGFRVETHAGDFFAVKKQVEAGLRDGERVARLKLIRD